MYYSGNFLKEISGILKQRTAVDDLVFTEYKTDNKGIGYFKFKQTYKGIPVIGGEYVITVQHSIQLLIV